MTNTPSFGKYVVTRLLGRGGMAEVYLASDPLLDRPVAIKVIYPHLASDEGFLERFRHEARFVASLRHPHIVRLYDFDVAAGHPFMVMEYLEGGTLKDRLAKQRADRATPPLGEIGRLLEAVSSALDYAHGHGAVHRDVKPTNILFTAQGEPVLTDFGVAKMLVESAHVSAAGSVIGSPSYMSPEQAASKPVDGRSDLYSLGVVLYEMVTGRVPFEGDSPTAILMQHLHSPPPPPRGLNPNLPAAVEAVILTALAKDPARRYASGRDLLRAYNAALSGQAPAEVSPDADTQCATAAASAAAPALAGRAEAMPQRSGWFAALVRNRRLYPALALALLGLLYVLAQFLGLPARLPDAAGRLWPWWVAALLAGSAVASLTAILRPAPAAGRTHGLATLALAALIGLAAAFAPRAPRKATGAVVIAVGEFDGSRATRKVDFARRVQERLESELRDQGGFAQVVLTRETYADSQAARARGMQSGATLVIWGWYDDVGVSPHVEALRVPQQPRESVGIPSLLQTVRAAETAGLAGPREPGLRDLARFVRSPATLPDFDLFLKDGPEQLTYVTNAVLGVVAYAAGDAARSLALFDRAIASGKAGGSDIVGQEVVYFQRATALHALGRAAEAVADLQAALAVKPALVEAHRNLAIAYAELCTPTWQITAAIAEAQIAARLSPDDASAHALLGDLYRQAGRYDEAIAAFQAALERRPDDADVCGVLAAAYAGDGRDAEAQAAFSMTVQLRESAVAGNPADPAAAHLALGEAYASAGEYDQALAEYETVLKIAPAGAAVHRGLGDAYYGKGELDSATREYRAWAAAAPADAGAPLCIGLLLTQQEKISEAVTELKKAAALSPCSAAPHLILAGVYWQQKEYALAAVEYQAALTFDPNNAIALYVLGVTQYLQGKLDEATAALQSALQLAPSFFEAHLALGKVHYDAQAFDKAAEEWEWIVGRAPNDPGSYIMLGSAYERLKRLDDAATAYQKALSLQDNAPTRVYLGSVYYSQRRYDAAVAEFRQATGLDAQNSLAYAGLGEAYAKLDRLDEAVVALQRSLALSADSGVLAELAEVYVRQGRTDLAIAEYIKAVALDDQFWLYRVSLASLYEFGGELDKAAAEYQAALSSDPGNPQANYGLAGLEHKRCNLTAATQYAATVVSAGNTGALYAGRLARLYEAQGRASEARNLYANLAAAPASDALAHWLSADYLYRTGSLQEAAREIQALLEQPALAPLLASVAHVGLAKVFYAQEQLTTAQSEFVRATDALTVNAEAEMWLGDLALQRGDAGKALSKYDAALALLPEHARQVSADGAATLAVELQARRGVALQRQSKPNDAKPAFDQAQSLAQALLAKAPQWAQAHFVRALAHTARGDKAAAVAEFALATQCDQALVAERVRAEALFKSLR